MKKWSRKVWVAMMVCGVIFLYLVSCQKKEEVEKTEIKEQLNEEKPELKEEPVLEDTHPNKDVIAGRVIIEETVYAKTTLRLSKEPRLGETVDAIFTITLPEDVPSMNVVFWGRAVEILDEGKELQSSAKRNETKEFVTKVKFVSSPAYVHARVKEVAVLSNGKRKILRGGSVLRREIIDEETKQFGTEEELRRGKPEYQYDPMLGKITNDVGSKSAKYNRKRMEELKKRDPTLTDWDALYLLHDLEVLFGEYGISGEKALEILLKARKMSIEKGITKEEALENILKERGYQKRGQFFRPDSDTGSGFGSLDSLPSKGTKVTTTFTGKWLYRKHLFNKDTGLDTTTVDRPVRRAVVWIWGSWPSKPIFSRISTPAISGSDGSYTISTDQIPSGEEAHVFPAVYMHGPARSGSEAYRIRVRSDTLVMTWDEADNKIWGFWELPYEIVYGGGTHDFGVDTAGTEYGLYPDNRQPRSGAANIYETLLEAYEYLVNNGHTIPESLGRVRVKWEPQYIPPESTSYYNNDTIYVLGDTLDTDEWDDMVLVHEYGHHVLANAAETPQYRTADHKWWEEYPNFWGTAYGEGWPTFYAAVVTDTIHWINTLKGINGREASYVSVENPWIGSGFPPDSFHGGVYCEGAVAGALWDVYDSYNVNEDPYPSYPKLPLFPDTGLVDTMSVVFDPIWDITYTYDPPPSQINRSWSIQHWYVGWILNNYGHGLAMRDILLHHRIIYPFMPANLDLKPKIEPLRKSLSLIWADTTTSFPIQGYAIYRKEPQDSKFSRVATVSDTFHTDSTVIRGRTYTYTTTSYDSFGVESDTSNHVTTWVPGSSNSGATSFNNGRKLVRDTTGTIFVTLTSGDSVLVGWTSNHDSTWQKVFIGLGKSPSIALDPSNVPWVFWIGIPDDHSIYYSIFDTTGVWSLPSPLHTFPTNLSFYSLSSVFGPGYGHTTVDGERNDADCAGCRFSYYLRFDTSLLQVLVSNFRGNESPTPTSAHSSVDSDILDTPHIVWDYRQWPDFGIIYYLTGIVVNPDSIDWAPPIPISSDTVNSAYPFLDEFDGELDVVWQGYSVFPNWEIFHRSSTGGIWGNINQVTSTSDPSLYPVITAGKYAVWVEDISGNSDIWYSMYVLGAWGPSEPIRITQEFSTHCHALFHQTPTDTNLIVTWTEGDSSITTEPFAIELEFKDVPGGLILKYYVDGGQVTPSPYTLQRAGYGRWGEDPSKTIDYHPEELVYRFDGLDPMKRYSIKAIFYYEEDPRGLISNVSKKNSGPLIDLKRVHPLSISPRSVAIAMERRRPSRGRGEGVTSVEGRNQRESNSQEGSVAPMNNSESLQQASEGLSIWEMGLDVNGLPLGTVNLKPKESATLFGVIPNGGCSDGSVTCSITRKAGDYVLLAELYLYEGDSPGTSDASQLEPHPKVFVLRQNFPNPFNRKTTILYQLPKDAQVSLKIYNITGQLVNALADKSQKAGYYSVPWDGKDREGRVVSSGIYFYRFIAKDLKEKNQLYASTRKIVYMK